MQTSSPTPAPSDPKLDALRQQFRRCSPETLEAIFTFRRTRDLVLVETVVTGILRRYLPKDSVEGLQSSPGVQMLHESGLDSLTLLEALLDMQDALEVTFNEEEIRGVKSMAELVDLLRTKVAAKE